MKVVNLNKRKCALENIDKGECFILDNHFCIKIHNQYEYNAFDLTDNQVKQIPFERIVEPVKTELHIL